MDIINELLKSSPIGAALIICYWMFNRSQERISKDHNSMIERLAEDHRNAHERLHRDGLAERQSCKEVISHNTQIFEKVLDKI